MPKRCNPFGEGSPLQFKTHVGKKELDMGVNMEHNMQNVYDRTKTLLFEGSKKATDCTSCDETQSWTAMECRGETIQPLPGQMRLDPEGRLCGKAECGASGPVTEPEPMCEEPVPMDGSGDAPPKSPSKQLQIDSSGKLYSGKPSNENQPKPMSTAGFCICHSCNRPTHIATRKCNFCEKSTCSSCLNQCCECQGVFCPVCSIMNYDDLAERSYCLQCPTAMV